MKLLYSGAEWDIPLLEKIWDSIDTIAKEDFGLDYPDSRIEIVTFDQMIANCSTHALPSLFNHWSFGLSELQSLEDYRKTGSGLAFEVVINTDPAIAYCQENNSTTMQTLVMAHAVCGHASFFKNNYMFKGLTDASAILPYMQAYQQHLTECESTHGSRTVEYLLDACFVLQHHAFNTAPRAKVSATEVWGMMEERLRYNEERDRSVDSTLPRGKSNDAAINRKDIIETLVEHNFYEPDQENILSLIAKNSVKLRPWQKKIVEGFCYMSQYFYPQYLTKVINEGYATFWHYQILKRMHEKGLINDASWLEAVDNHCKVTYQQSNVPNLNPYALGFNIFMDIKRMSEEPDDEDRKLFPTVAGGDWKENVKWAMENYNDSSFILQYLSPKVVKKMELANYNLTSDSFTYREYEITALGEVRDLNTIRKALSDSYTMDKIRPLILGEVHKHNQIKSLILQLTTATEIGKLEQAVRFLWGEQFKIESMISK